MFNLFTLKYLFHLQKCVPTKIFRTPMSDKYQNPALHNDFSFKSTCSKSTFLTVHFPIQVDVWIHNQIKGFQSFFFSEFFKNKILKDPLFHVNKTVNQVLVIRNPKTLCYHFKFFAPLCTNCYEMKGQTRNPFKLCLKLYIPLQHLCRTLQWLTHWCDPGPQDHITQKNSKWFF